MKTRNRISRIRRIIGDILLVLVILLIVDVAFVMPVRINAEVLKADYRKVFMYSGCPIQYLHQVEACNPQSNRLDSAYRHCFVKRSDYLLLR